MLQQRLSRALPAGFVNPPSQFSLMPFWFWNDRLDADEIVRQIEGFVGHGVQGFVIHPRMGLPREMTFLSPEMLAMMEVAIEEAAARGMKVILYDEGMYPSGSACGQVIAANATYQCRCLAGLVTEPGQPPILDDDAHLVASFDDLHIIDRPVDAVIRGIHYEDEAETREHEPPAGDILNPAAVQTFIRLVHERFAAAFGHHFGRTILGIFTDEPNPLGRCRETGVWPGTTGIVAEVSRLLGDDFTPFLPALFDDAFPDAEHHRRRYHEAIRRRLEETWYRPLQDWCHAHGLWLMGHPERGDELGVQRFFDVPGQDLVWRWVLPDHPTALEGPESTQAKCSSSAMLHLGRQRNSNEFCGAYGHELTFDEMRWLANWCLVRGVNLLIPHAFYYSVRGPRRDERPPDVGPHSAWWDRFGPFADHCRRLCWVNTDSRHVCDVAVLADPDACPWLAAKALLEAQHDFNYVDLRQFIEDGQGDRGLRIAGMRYAAVVLEPGLTLPPAAHSLLAQLEADGRLIRWTGAAEAFIAQIRTLSTHALPVEPPQPALCYRHVIKDGWHFFLLFNEGAAPIAFRLLTPHHPLVRVPTQGDEQPMPLTSDRVEIAGHEMILLGSPTRSHDEPTAA